MVSGGSSLVYDFDLILIEKIFVVGQTNRGGTAILAVFSLRHYGRGGVLLIDCLNGQDHLKPDLRY